MSCRSYSSREALIARRELLLQELFRLHDLNKDGLLDELELVKLNQKIAMLHYGKEADKAAVRSKYQELFRSKLDADGDPVSYEIFRAYMLDTLHGLDTDQKAQELIVE